MAETDFTGGGDGARCAHHPELPATGTCARCGNFMCDTCRQGGTQSFCPPCQERTGLGNPFPLRRDTWRFGSLWDFCFGAFKREWVTLSLAALVALLILAVAQLAGSLLPLVGSALDSEVLSFVLLVTSVLAQNVVQGVVFLGLMRLLFDVLEGRRANIGQLFSQIHKAGRYLLAILTVMVAVGIPLLLLLAVAAFLGGFSGGADLENDPLRFMSFLGLFTLVVGPPLLYLTLPLYLLQPELAFNDEATAFEALRNCYALGRGERLRMFGVLLVSFLVMVGGTLLCCVGFVPGLALGQLLNAGLYLALRNGSSLSPR